MRVILGALILCLCLFQARSQQVTVNYHMGGPNTSPQNVQFTFSRSGDVTTVSWAQFGASADADGIIYSADSDAFPAGFPISNLYGGSVEAMTRWSYVYDNDDGYLQLSSAAPYVTFRPNTPSGVFAAAQIITVRPGSLKYSNVDVVQGGDTTNAALATTLTASTTLAAASTTALQGRATGGAEGFAAMLLLVLGALLL